MLEMPAGKEAELGSVVGNQKIRLAAMSLTLDLDLHPSLSGLTRNCPIVHLMQVG